MKSTIHPVTPPTMKSTIPPQGRIAFALFEFLSALQDCEPHIKNQTTRHDLADICHSTAKTLENAADRFRVTPAKARVLHQIQNKIKNTTHN